MGSFLDDYEWKNTEYVFVQTLPVGVVVVVGGGGVEGLYVIIKQVSLQTCCSKKMEHKNKECMWDVLLCEKKKFLSFIPVYTKKIILW